MSILLFKLHSVPEDEAQDIRDLLSQNNVDFYETSAGILGFSLPGIWLADESQIEMARTLIDDYQRKRLKSAQTEYRKQIESGRARTITDIFREAPTLYIGYLLIIGLIMYFSIILFIRLV